MEDVIEDVIEVIEVPFGAFENFPTDMKILILQTMDFRDLIHLCSTNKIFGKFCRENNKRIWLGKIKWDFNVEYIGPEDQKGIYQDLYQANQYYEEYGDDTLFKLITREKENYFGILWLIEEKKLDPSVNYNNAIGWASSNGHLKVVELLLSDNRTDPSAEHNTAIRWASENGRLEVVELLLQDERVANGLTDEDIQFFLQQADE